MNTSTKDDEHDDRPLAAEPITVTAIVFYIALWVVCLRWMYARLHPTVQIFTFGCMVVGTVLLGTNVTNVHSTGYAWGKTFIGYGFVVALVARLGFPVEDVPEIQQTAATRREHSRSVCRRCEPRGSTFWPTR